MPALIGKTMEFLEQEAVKKDKAGNKLSAQALLDVKYPIKGLLISFWKAIEMRQAEGEKMLE